MYEKWRRGLVIVERGWTTRRSFDMAPTLLPFSLLRCGTSRGPFFWGSDLPPTEADRDALLCAVMGAGSAGQVDGIGGGTGVTSKAVFLDRAPAEDQDVDIEFNFAQVGINVHKVNHSHGDCLNMFTGVTPFVLSAGMVGGDRGTSATLPMRIRSMETGLLAEQWIDSECGGQGRQSTVKTRMVGCAGAMTGKLLPADGAAIVVLGGDLPEVSIVDFSRIMVIVDAADVGVSVDTEMCDPILCSRLEAVRLAGARAAGLGDCSAKDSPKLCVVAKSEGAQLRAWYWVNPGRSEPHPTLAITGASCLAAACELPGTIPHALCTSPAWADAAGVDGEETAKYSFEHGLGARSVTLWRRAGAAPHGVAYNNNVRIIASGQLFVDGGAAT